MEDNQIWNHMKALLKYAEKDLRSLNVPPAVLRPFHDMLKREDDASEAAKRNDAASKASANLGQLARISDFARAHAKFVIASVFLATPVQGTNTLDYFPLQTLRGLLRDLWELVEDHKIDEFTSEIESRLKRHAVSGSSSSSASASPDVRGLMDTMDGINAVQGTMKGKRAASVWEAANGLRDTKEQERKDRYGRDRKDRNSRERKDRNGRERKDRNGRGQGNQSAREDQGEGQGEDQGVRAKSLKQGTDAALHAPEEDYSSLSQTSLKRLGFNFGEQWFSAWDGQAK